MDTEYTACVNIGAPSNASTTFTLRVMDVDMGGLPRSWDIVVNVYEFVKNKKNIMTLYVEACV